MKRTCPVGELLFTIQSPSIITSISAAEFIIAAGDDVDAVVPE